jgi:hypothetical protein
MKRFFIILIVIGLLGCASHPYVLNKSEPTDESFHFAPQFIFGLVGTNEVYSEDVCPNKKIRLINMHDSFFNGFICGGTLFIFCPHTIGIQCTK